MLVTCMPVLRDYVPADFECLWELDQKCFTPEIAYSRDELAYYLRASGATCVLAVENEEPIAFILGHRRRNGVGHIVTLDVSPATRSRGLGSMLISTLETRFQSVGCDSILLEVAVNNLVAIRFYKKHGYSVLKTLRRYYPGGLDGLVMAKRLG